MLEKGQMIYKLVNCKKEQFKFVHGIVDNDLNIITLHGNRMSLMDFMGKDNCLYVCYENTTDWYSSTADNDIDFIEESFVEIFSNELHEAPFSSLKYKFYNVV